MLNIPVDYHFRVDFILMPNPIDMRFQEVSGLAVTLNDHDVQEGLAKVKLAHGVEYGTLTLKRGMATEKEGSAISAYFNRAMEYLEFEPQTIMVTLLDDLGLPRGCWWFLQACPHKWSVSDFNAESNKLVIETLEFTYQSMKVVKV